MMALAMLACRTNTPPSLLPETFGPKKIHIPKAPPLGLLLQSPVFKTYNDRIKYMGNAGNQRKKGAAPAEGDVERDPVDLSVHEEEMEAFKVKWIYERLRQDELEQNV
jgi:tRNA pseudouridine38-40 synthase